MKRIALAALISVLAMGAALAQAPAPDSCDAKVGAMMKKDGVTPIAGAAKAAALKKCKRDACTPKAVSSEGKPLAGAAKKSFMTKCETGA